MPVAIISEALARDSFPNQDPIGQRLQCGLDSVGKWMTIVGVVGDVRQNSPASSPEPELYMPLQQHPYYRERNANGDPDHDGSQFAHRRRPPAKFAP